MEAQLKGLIQEFFERKQSFKSLLKTNPDTFKPIVFQEFTDTAAYNDFLATQGTTAVNFHPEADRVFTSYIQADLA